LEQEVAVDVEVAALIAVNLHSKGVHNVFLVEVVTDPTESRVAEVVAILALSTDVVHIHSGALVRTNEGIVAVDASGNARPHTTAVVAVLDQRLAARKSIIHAAALGFVKNSRIATLATGHGTVMFILRVTVGQAIANENRLEVDVPVLVGQDLGSENRDVVASIRLASNVEVLLSILGELVEEESEERIDILAGSDSVADGVAGVGVSDVDGLIKEDHAGVVVPAELIVDNLELLVDGRRPKLKE